MTLGDALLSAVSHLPSAFRESAAPLWRAEHLEHLGDRLTALYQSVVDRPAPNFSEETTPPLEPLFAPWRPLLGETARSDEWVRAIAFRLEATGLDDLLILMGMRRTPGSLSGVAAIPPTVGELIRAAEEPHRPDDALTVAARAWTKHVPRSSSSFWGKVSGSAVEQNRIALGLIRRLLREATWWNVHEHFQRGAIYEVRIPAGQGVRWEKAGPRFIGFVEPFVEGGIEATA